MRWILNFMSKFLACVLPLVYHRWATAEDRTKVLVSYLEFSAVASIVEQITHRSFFDKRALTTIVDALSLN